MIDELFIYTRAASSALVEIRRPQATGFFVGHLFLPIRAVQEVALWMQSEIAIRPTVVQ